MGITVNTLGFPISIADQEEFNKISIGARTNLEWEGSSGVFTDATKTQKGDYGRQNVNGSYSKIVEKVLSLNSAVSTIKAFSKL